MCEACDRLVEALENGTEEEIDIAETEWWKAQLLKVDRPNGYLVRFHASDSFKKSHGDLYLERSRCVEDAAEGFLAILAKKMGPRAVETGILESSEFQVATMLVERLIDRAFWFGIHTAERHRVMKAFAGGDDERE